MLSELDRLQREIRDACPTGLWSRGVKLSRAHKVELESQTDREAVFRIATGRGIAPTVVLYPGDRDWECDCDGRFDACEHVAAAIVTLALAEKEGVAVATADPSGAGRILYLLSRRRGQLVLERQVIASDGTTSPLERSVAAHVAGIAKSHAALKPDRADLEADSALGPHPAPVLSEKVGGKLAAALAGNERVRLDGEPVAISAERVAPVARVSRQAGGIVLSVARSSLVDEVLAPGLALCDGTIQPLAATKVTGSSLEHLPLTRAFRGSQVGELVGKVLPALRREIAVRIDEDVELPGLARGERPRIDLGLGVSDGDDASVEVLPRLVYGQPPVARVDGETLVHLRGKVPVRNKPAERDLIETLRSELNLVCNRSVGFRGAEATAFLRDYRNSSFAENAEQLAAALALKPRVFAAGGRICVAFETADGGTVDAREVISAWEANNQLVPVAGGVFGRLPDNWLAAHGEMVRELLLAEASVLRALPAAAALAASADVSLPPALAALEPLARKFESLPTAPLPSDFSGELRAYQQIGVNWLRFLAQAKLGAVLADDMGLGKTIQVLASLPTGTRTLVVAPTSTLPNWRNEVEKFRPHMTTCMFHGAARELTPADITITSYALMRNDIETLEATEWDCVVLDEAQAIKNPNSQAARASRRLRAKARIAMSGTPVETRLEELWSIGEFVNPGLLGSETEFARRFSKPIAEGDRTALELLRSRLRPVVLRRRKAQVAPELPPRTEVVVRCELDDNEREIYNAIAAAARADVVRKLQSGGSPMAALTALLRLRQAACHPALLPDRQATTSSKLEELLDLLSKAVAGEHKALVFSQWTSFLDLIEPELTRLGIAFVRLDGSTRDRGAVVDAFQSGDGPPVMLISLKAGGTGLNLTAADHVFLLDPWWNPAVEEQAADRAHRIGQDKPVLVHRLVASDTVEDRILALKAAKLALAQSALGDVGAGAAMTRDDLLALLE